MRAGMIGLGLVLSVAGCGSPTKVCLDDYDADGLCGAADPCPLDTTNDEDADGVCGSVDICPAGSDFDDEDADLVPDACDECLGDVLNDPDEDDICGNEDKCPAELGEDCLRYYTIGLAVDPWYAESSWTMVADGLVVDEGLFDSAGDGVYGTWSFAASTERVCIELADTFGDGGVRGQVWDELLGIEVQSWGTRDWNSDESFCFDIKGGAPTGEPRTFDESDYLNGLKTCQATIVMVTAAWGSECYWQLLDSRSTVLRSVPARSYGDYQTSTYTQDLYDGDFVFRMQDTLGDSWHGGYFEVRLSPEGEAIATGSMGSGMRSEDVPFTVVCPDDDELVVP